jgi:cell shape-determining protein MreD
MTYGFHIFIGFLLIVLQTCFAPLAALPGDMYDLQIALMLYLVLFRPIRENLFAAVFIGVAMDSMSAAPFGVYSLTYLLIFISGTWTVRFLQSGNRYLLPFFVMYGVVMENLIFAGVCFLPGSVVRPPADAMASLGEQVIWALLTGAFLVRGIRLLHRVWHHWMKELFPGETEAEKGSA